VERYLASLLRARSGSRRPRLALDIETHGDIDVLHPVERPLVCLAVYDGQGAVVIPRSLLGPADYQGRDTPWPELLRLLSGFSLELHNGLFDIPTLCSRLAEPGVDPESYGVRVGFDTMLAHYTIRPAAEQGLKALSKVMLGADDWDLIDRFPELARRLFGSDRAGWWKHAWPVMEAVAERMSVVDKKTGEWLAERRDVHMDMQSLATEPEFLVHLYNGYDVLNTWELREELTPLLKAVEGAATAVVHLHRFANAIMWDELYGFPVDTGRAAHLCELLDKEIAEQRARVQELAYVWSDPESFPGKEFNPNSPPQVKKVYADSGLSLKKTDKKVLGELAAGGDAFARELLVLRSLVKELGTYAAKARDATNDVFGHPALFPWYNLCSTVTGRLSSSGVTNIQNWPKQEEFEPERQLRSVFTHRPGPYTLVQVDYSQAELRVMAAESGDDWLIGIFSDPAVDIFTTMTKQIFPHLRDEKQIKLWRRPLKSVVYGLAYGRGARAIADELKIPVEQAQAVMDGFLGLADELDVWLKDVGRRATRGEDLVTRFGRHFQHEVITPRNRSSVKRSALSFIPQSTASDLTLTAYMALRRWIRENRRDWIFRAVVHDSLTYDVPVAEADEAQQVIGDFMSTCAQAKVPEVAFAVDGSMASTWNLT
jgi:DNA polymerase I-like protein with 3'-5' exonuclease and polymerase domains